MEEEFSWHIDDRGDGTFILVMHGTLNEDVNTKPILEALGSVQYEMKLLRIDTRGVNQINSCGVREWILLMEKMQFITSCHFSSLSHAFVEQANTVANMIGKPPVAVDFFEAPYYCKVCDTQSQHLLSKSDLKKMGPLYTAPAFKCERCKADLEIDFFEDEYFTFLKKLPG